MTEEKQNEWIEWSGGECPPADWDGSIVRFRNGIEGPTGRGAVYWRHTVADDDRTDPDLDIVAYRIVNALASTDRELEA